MGLMAGLVGLLPAVGRTAEVFVANRTERARQEHAEHVAALGQFAAEFQHPSRGFFDRLIDGVNRLPRPVMAIGTMGLFVFAMADPVAFGVRMQGLALVPDPLWWLLGAIVSFYFGARELHHFRSGQPISAAEVRGVVQNMAAVREIGEPADPPPDEAVDGPDAGGNAALSEWRAANGQPV